jgi:predicted O-linked N-acetylglucosamine transferase (SPINDLY family)
MGRHATVMKQKQWASPSSTALNRAVTAHRDGRLADAERGYRSVLAKHPRHTDAWHLLGVVAHDLGEHAVAEERIRRALGFGAGGPIVWNNLGRTLAAQERLDEAVSAYTRAIDADPAYADAHLNRALALAEQGRFADAIPDYQRAIELDEPIAQTAAIHTCLGCALEREGYVADALGAFMRAIVLNAGNAAAHANLDALLAEIGGTPEAEESHRQATALVPGIAEAHNEVGLALREQGRAREAAAAFRRALASRPQFAEAHANLATAMIELGDVDAAVDGFEAARAYGLDDGALHHNRAIAQQLQGNLHEAALSWRRSIALAPDPARVIRLATMLPVVPASADELRESRARLEKSLDELMALNIGMRPFDVPLVYPNFYLAYQAMDDRVLQEKMHALLLKACPSLGWEAPGLGERAHRGGRLRVGIVSRYLSSHTIGKLTRGFVEGLDRQRFEVVVIQAGGEQDAMAAAIAAAADKAVRLPRRLRPARQHVAELGLDLLFYPDIGMDPFTYFLAYARLAPAQLTTWGHPVTTGIPNVDWFVSADALEPDGADAHYTEKLARLSRLPTSYRAPDTSGIPDDPAECRRQLGIAADGTLYVCAQSLFKLHPDNDAVFGEILRRDPRGHLVLLHGQSTRWSQVLSARFGREFPEALGRVWFMPRLSFDKFLMLLRAADVVLDPLHWTGGNSTFEAFALGAPVITWPGEFMRGRVTAAAARQAGVPEMVAGDTAQYVDLALRLAQDRAWRTELSSRLHAGRHEVFDDTRAVRELERVFLQAAGR